MWHDFIWCNEERDAKKVADGQQLKVQFFNVKLRHYPAIFVFLFKLLKH